MLIQLSFADWSKINNINKKRSNRKNWFKLCLWAFSKKESYVEHMSFYITRGWNRQVISDRVVQWSTPWVVFLWPPIKVSLVCGFPPSLCMITLNPLPLCSSGPTNITTMTRHTKFPHTKFPLTLLYSLAPRPQNFHEIPTHSGAKGVSQIHSPVSGVNFSNNITIP